MAVGARSIRISELSWEVEEGPYPESTARFLLCRRCHPRPGEPSSTRKAPVTLLRRKSSITSLGAVPQQLHRQIGIGFNFIKARRCFFSSTREKCASIFCSASVRLDHREIISYSK